MHFAYFGLKHNIIGFLLTTLSSSDLWGGFVAAKKILQRFALHKAHVDFESEIKSLPREHDFSSISLWIALKLETPTYLKISEVRPCLFFL